MNSRPRGSSGPPGPSEAGSNGAPYGVPRRMILRPLRSLASNGGLSGASCRPARGSVLRRCDQSGVTRPSGSSRKVKSLSLAAPGVFGTSRSWYLQTGAPERQRPTIRADSHSVVAWSGTALARLSSSSLAATCDHQPGTSWASRRITWKEPLRAHSGYWSLGKLNWSFSRPQTNSPAGMSRVPGWPSTSSGLLGFGRSKPLMPGSLMPSLKPKCSLPRRLPSRVCAFCW